MPQHSPVRRTPLDAEERARAEAGFASLVTEHLLTSGRFRGIAFSQEETTALA